MRPRWREPYRGGQEFGEGAALKGTSAFTREIVSKGTHVTGLQDGPRKCII